MQFRHYFAHDFGIEVPIATGVFAAVLLAMAIAFVISRARRKRAKGSVQRAEFNALELSYLAFIALIATFIAYTSLTTNNSELAAASTDPALTVRVIGYQWCWRFHYVGEPITVIGQCEQSRYPVLVLPAHRSVRLEVTSDDVVHGFWLTYWRWKRYAYPNYDNAFTVNLGHTGSWIGRCSEFCGLFHDHMDWRLRVVPPAQFARWLRAHGGTVPPGVGK